MRSSERLKHLADIFISTVDKKSAADEQPVVLCNYTDVYYNARIADTIEFMAATARPDQVRRFTLRSGDILLTKDSETADDIAVSALVPKDLPGVVCGYHLAVVRANQSRVDPSYLFWTLRSDTVRCQFITAATGVTRFGLRSEAIGDATIPMCPLAEQRAIADYLDTEASRIGALIAKKTRMISLLNERERSWSIRLVLGDLGKEEGSVSPSGLYQTVPIGWQETALRHVGCDVQTGPFGSQLHAEDYVEGGWPVVNPMNIVGGQIVATEHMTISDDKRKELSRHMLRSGDIVFGRRGEMGRAGLVKEPQEGWLCGTGSLRLRLHGSFLLPEYLKLLLETPVARAYFELASVGSTMDNLNSEIVLAFPALIPPALVQREIAEAVAHRRRLAGLTIKRLTCQIQLLTERRQALIAAAVTGELKIPTTEAVA